jgi:hypothetical protein
VEGEKGSPAMTSNSQDGAANRQYGNRKLILNNKIGFAISQ